MALYRRISDVGAPLVGAFCGGCHSAGPAVIRRDVRWSQNRIYNLMTARGKDKGHDRWRIRSMNRER